MTIDELENAILKSSHTKCFDIDGRNVTMIENLGIEALLHSAEYFQGSLLRKSCVAMNGALSRNETQTKQREVL